MFQKLETVATRCMQLDKLLSDSEVITDQKLYQQYAKERSDLSELLDTYQHYQKVCSDLAEAEELALESDEELKQMAKTEALQLKEEKVRLEEKLKRLLLPKDPRDEKNVITYLDFSNSNDFRNIYDWDLYYILSWLCVGI